MVDRGERREEHVPPEGLGGDDPRQAEAIAFLGRDFDQCFEQLRHYDSLSTNTLKFALTSGSASIGLALAAEKVAQEKDIDLDLVLIGILASGLLTGLVLLAMLVRYRVYFVRVARYINEQRRLFLAERPLGFENVAGMYTDPAQPPFFNWASPDSAEALVVGVFNAVLLGGIALVLTGPIVAAIVGVATLAAQCLLAARRLSSYERRAARRHGSHGVD